MDRERLERSRRWRWARARAGKHIAKEIDRRVRGHGVFVVGTPGGFEQKADGESSQNGPRERLERSLGQSRARTWAENKVDQRFASTRTGMGFSRGRAWRFRTNG